MHKLARTLINLFGSRRFFWIVWGFFVFEALWFVFSAMYPMAFDEDFHFGIIKIYADQWSPFLTQHPAGADQFGAVVRDPSYLFHYMMSFPYRFIALFTDSQTVQVILLRLMNVAMAAAALVLFRKVMLHARASPALAHVVLALFVLIPIVPQLAAHINYDNLVMLLVPLMCLSVFALVECFGSRRINAKALLAFVVVCLFMSVVKYAVLPLIAAAVFFVLYRAFRSFKGHARELLPAARRGFSAVSRPACVLLIALALIGSVLFAQRYVVNMALYKTPVPDCGQVLSVEQCVKYGPWGRDYYLAQNKSDTFTPNPAWYINTWFNGMWHRLFFAINGSGSDFTNYLELPVPSKTAIIVSIFGLLSVILCWRRVFADNGYLGFFALMIAVYVAVLWLQQYGMYKETGQPVAINGRYLLPILPLLAVIMGRGISLLLRRVPDAKAALATLAILLFLHGGGVFTFMLRSDSTWYWQNQTVIRANNAARDVLAPIIIEGPKG